MKASNKLLALFLTFLKIGAFTFGGGYAMLALLENEFITKKKWLDKQEFLDMAAIAESTPGPVAINSATYLGYRMAGVRGAAVATLAVCIPSFVIIYIISLFLDRFLALTYVAHAFHGIQVCVVYLIITAGLRMLRSLERDPVSLCILLGVGMGMLLCTLFAVSFSSVYYILLSGAVGILAGKIHRICRKEGKP